MSRCCFIFMGAGRVSFKIVQLNFKVMRQLLFKGAAYSLFLFQSIWGKKWNLSSEEMLISQEMVLQHRLILIALELCLTLVYFHIRM